MATDQLSTSRRAVIKALAAAPIIATAKVVEAAAIGSDIAPAIGWDHALAAYRGAQAEWVAHPYARTLPTSPDYRRLQAEEEGIADRAIEALHLVLRTPVPDHAAFVEKMDVYGREFEDMSDGYFAHLIADARRLRTATG